MKILLTGGNGMLGKAIRRLAPPDVELVCPSRQELDLCDKEAVRRYVQDRPVDLVIHAAAKVGGIAANIANPIDFLTENIAINVNVAMAAADAGVRHLIFVGSSCMYPKDYTNPLKEEYLMAAPLEETNEGYALAKIVGARLCAYLSSQRGLFYRTIMPCNLYGPGDHFEPERSHLVAAAIQKVGSAQAQGQDSVLVWGDGTARREFLYVDDLASWLLSLSTERIEAMPEMINVGAGYDHTVREYYEAVMQVLGFDGRLDFDVTKPKGMQRKLMDSSRAAAFGWAPRTSLAEGIALTWEYFKANGGH